MRSKPASRRRTAASRSASSTVPSLTAASSVAPRAVPGPGISRSRPAPSDVAVSATANQSVMTRPSKPHSSRRRSIEELGLLGEPPAVHPVVRGHDPERAALLHRQLEGQQVQLAQRPLVDDRVDRAALELGVVAHEVLHRGEHAGGLHASHVARGQLAREQRVLGVALEVATGEGGAVEVHGGGEQARGTRGRAPRGRAAGRAARPAPGPTSPRAPSRTGCRSTAARPCPGSSGPGRRWVRRSR